MDPVKVTIVNSTSRAKVVPRLGGGLVTVPAHGEVTAAIAPLSQERRAFYGRHGVIFRAEGDAAEKPARRARSPKKPQPEVPQTDVPQPLRTDGPTVAEFVAAGFLASEYPPQGYAARSTPEEIAAAIGAQGGSTEADGDGDDESTSGDNGSSQSSLLGD